MAGTVTRIRTAKGGLAQLPVFANDICGRLELFRIGGAADCRRLLDVIRPYLEDLAARGGPAMTPRAASTAVESLAEIVDAGRPGVAIAGTSGKSTITGMVGWLRQKTCQ